MSAQELAAFVTSRPAEAFAALWRVTLQALGAWVLTAPVIVAVVFFALRPVLRVWRFGCGPGRQRERSPLWILAGTGRRGAGWALKRAPPRPGSRTSNRTGGR